MNKELLEITYSKVGFIPTEAQWPPLLCDLRTIVTSGGVRAGKSLLAAMFALGRWPFTDLIWFVAKDYSLCRQEFDYFLQAALKLNIMADPAHPHKCYGFPAKDQCWAELLGGKRVVTKSLRDPMKIAMEAPDLIIVCEVAQCEWDSWLKLIERTAEKRGTIFGTGTLEGSLGWFPELVEFLSNGREEGKSFTLPSWSNIHVFPGGRQDPEILHQESTQTNDFFLERFAGIPCKPSGLVIKEFSHSIHVGNYPFDKNVPVEITIDPGSTVYAVEVIQEVDGQERLIDEIYLSGYVAEEIIEICKQREWWGNVVTGYRDVANPDAGKVWLNQANLNLQFLKVEIEPGIDLLRSYLKPNPINNKPKIVVDYKCKGFIAECGGGLDIKLKEDVEGAGPWLRDKNTGKPLKKNDHACKSLIYRLAKKYGWMGMHKRRTRQKFTLG